MSRWEKLIADILAKNPNLRFEDLSKALIRLGYLPIQPKGGSSHYTFRKRGSMPITIPKLVPLKSVYIELVAAAIQKDLEGK